MYSYDEHRMLLKTRGHLHSTVGSWCVRINLRCLLIQSFDLHTAGLHHLPTQWGVRANCNSITVTRFVISSFTFHLTRLDLQHIRYALTINFWKKIFCTWGVKYFLTTHYICIAHKFLQQASNRRVHCRIAWVLSWSATRLLRTPSLYHTFHGE